MSIRRSSFVGGGKLSGLELLYFEERFASAVVAGFGGELDEFLSTVGRQ